MKKFTLLAFSFLLNSLLFAQVYPGQWTEHVSYFVTKSVAMTDDKVYCAAGQGMYFINRADQSINPFNKLKGLSDIDISVIRYASAQNLLVIGYENGNIDLLNNSTGKITNIPDLHHKAINYSKRINNIWVEGTTAYLACGFGVLVIDLARKEISDTYFIGNLGDLVQVNDICVFNQTIYAATANGLLSCPLSSPFPSDYRNWTKENVPYQGTQTTEALGIVNQNLLVSATYAKDATNDDIFMLSNGVWTHTLFAVPAVRKMSNANGKLAICGKSKLLVLNNDGSEFLSLDKFDRGTVILNEATVDKDGTIWMTDSLYSLGKINDKNIVRLQHNCPRYTGLSQITANNAGDVWVAGGGPSQVWSGYGGYKFNGGIWKTYNFESYWQSYPVKNFYRIAISQYDPTHVWMGSWGFGVIEFQNDQFVQIFDQSNSVLKAINDTYSYLWVSGIAYDSQDNLWITTSNVPQVAYVKKRNSKTIQAVPLNFQGSGSQYIGDLMITSNNTKWIILKQYGILAFDDRGNELKFTVNDVNGATVSNNVLCMAQDKDGAVWVGTDAGVAIYSSPESVFANKGFYAYRPVVTNQYLLSSQRVTAIAVDGANRKWIGTESSGVFLISADGTVQIQHYTTDNSPMLSNQVISVGINPQSGEVFIGTDKGLVSVGSDASSGKEDYEGIYAYPNPVRPGYDGDITIAGLMDNSNVKITDVAGNLVFETQSQGGMATWNGKNMHGAKVSTGVYLIFCANGDGTQSKVSKLLFVK